MTNRHQVFVLSGGVGSSGERLVRDLEFAHGIVRRGRFASVDVSMKPIEESANEVVSWVGAARG